MTTAVHTVTHSGQLRRVQTANSTATSFTALVPTTTAPLIGDTGTFSTHIQGSGANVVANSVIFFPFGRDADTETFDMRVYAIWPLITTTTQVWIQPLIAGFTCTLGAGTGVDGSDLEDEDFMCDTIATVVGIDTGVTISSGVANEQAYIVIPIHGAPLLTTRFDLTGAAQANALYALI